MSCVIFGEVGVIRGWLSLGTLRMYRMLGLNLVVHEHGVVGHVHCSNHYGIVVSQGQECWLLAYDCVASCEFLG